MEAHVAKRSTDLWDVASLPFFLPSSSPPLCPQALFDHFNRSCPVISCVIQMTGTLFFSFFFVFPSIIHRAFESRWCAPKERKREWEEERGGLLMVWGIKAQNKVAEIHTHKPWESRRRGLLDGKWWLESLELREALGWVWSAPVRALFTYNQQPKYWSALTWLQGRPIRLIRSSEKCNFCLRSIRCLLVARSSVRSSQCKTDLKVHFKCRSSD